MKTQTLFTALLAMPWALAQNQPDLSTETLTMLDPSGSTLVATVTLVNSAAAQTLGNRQQQERSTLATSISAPPEEPAITSVLQATRTESAYYAPSTSSSANLDENGIDVEAGASGSSSSGFSLSKGGMIAVIVVVVSVAVFGVLSITLFILAKKRQWKVRESIKRASRRLTGRSAGPKSRSDVDRKKRSGVIAGSRGQRAPPSTPLVPQKGTAVSETEMTDLEKGGRGKGGSGAGGGWLGKMKGNDWR